MAFAAAKVAMIFEIFHDMSYKVPMYVKMFDNCNDSEPPFLPTRPTHTGLFACTFWQAPRSLGRSRHVSAFFWQQESRRLGHNYVGTEMLLVGVVADTSGPSGKVLKKFNVTLKDGNLVCQSGNLINFFWQKHVKEGFCIGTITPTDFIRFPGNPIWRFPKMGVFGSPKSSKLDIIRPF